MTTQGVIGFTYPPNLSNFGLWGTESTKLQFNIGLVGEELGNCSFGHWKCMSWNETHD